MKVNNILKRNGGILGFLILLIFPIKVLATTGYGEGIYGSGIYSPSRLTQNPTNNLTPSFNTSPPGCNNSVTPNTPDLFEIRANKNSATLFFTPPTENYSSFYIAFSKKLNVWEYGTEYNQEPYSGVLKYTIYLLTPNTTYYAKIRPGNNCATGNWSDTMSFTTQSSSKEKTFYKYSKINTAIKTVKTIINKVIPKTKIQSKPTINLPNIYTNTYLENTTAPTINKETRPTPTTILQETPITNETKITQKKKFCILWLCFN